MRTYHRGEERRAAVSVLAVLALALAACGDRDSADQSGPASVAKAQVVPYRCAVEFELEITTFDSSAALYGLPVAQTEVIPVCESWVNGDYRLQYDYSTAPPPPVEFSYRDSVGLVQYNAGRMTMATPLGVRIDSSRWVGNSAFEVVNATVEERNASIADPYYGLIASAELVSDSTVTDTSSGGALRAMRGSVEVATQQANGRRPVRRRALRALLTGMTEEDTPAPGLRRFRGRRGDADVTLDVDSLELIREERVSTSQLRTHARHEWTRQGRHWVKASSDISAVEVGAPEGRTLRMQTRFRKMRIDTTVVR